MTANTDRGSRFARLPLWAQAEIRNLEARAESAQRALKAAEDAANGVLSAQNAAVWLNPYDAVPQPVAQAGERVRFSLADGGTLHSLDWVDVTVSRLRKRIEVSAGRGVRIRPQASNTFSIELENY